ncbi:MAG TPA: CpsD/CapB family tyrosine-protein kinase [Thermomicrobiaceae bacterium]|nr:CpsD/CapB family tyrosine-protein kinase [Thermomicrobiaceae bacterium]
MWGKTRASSPVIAPDGLVRDLYTRLFLHAGGATSLVLGVTSALDQEGKTTTALNLASVLASDRGVVDSTDGKGDVLVVDCHRSPITASHYLGVAPGPGLTDYLKRSRTLDDVICPTDRHYLKLMRAGDDPHNLSVLIRTEAMWNMIRTCRERFRLTILDLPSVLTTSDTQVLAGLVDRVVLVVRSGVTPARAITDALTRVDRSKFVGIVLNDHRRDLPAWLDSRL